MDPLSRDADEALKSLHDVEPTGADEARVRAGLESALGVALPMAAAGTAAVGAAAGVKAASSGFFASLGVGTKVTLLAVALAGAGAVTTVAVKTTAPRVPVVAKVRPAPPRPPPEPELPPEPDTPTSPELELVLVAPPEPPRKVRPAPVAKPPPPAALETPPPPPAREADVEAPPESVDAELARDYPGCDLATEQRLAAHVRAMPRHGTAERGLGLLTAFQHRCATGHWTYDSWVARFAVLCALDRREEFNELWAWFRQENDRHVWRVRRELEGQCVF